MIILSAVLSISVRPVLAVAGAHQQLPKYAPSSVTRAAKSECAPYLELATAYSKSDEAVSKVITQHAQTFQEVLLSIPLPQTLRKPETPIAQLCWQHSALTMHASAGLHGNAWAQSMGQDKLPA